MSFGIDHTGKFQERLINMRILPDRGLHIMQFILPNKLEHLFLFNFFLEVALVAYQHDGRLFGLFPEKGEPFCLDVFKGLALWEVEYEEDAVAAFEVGWDDAAVALLAGGVPDEQFDGVDLLGQGDLLHFEVDCCYFVAGLVIRLPLRKLHKQRGLADRRIPHQDDLILQLIRRGREGLLDSAFLHFFYKFLIFVWGCMLFYVLGFVIKM